MKIIKPLLAAALVIVAFAACKNLKYKKTQDGMAYSVLGGGSGPKIVAGNIIRYFERYELEDSVLGTSYGVPAQWMPIAKSGRQHPLAVFVLGAQKGDSILVLRPVDSIIARAQTPVTDSFLLKNRGRNIKHYIKITEVFADDVTAQAAFEKEAIVNYNNDPQTAGQRSKDDAAITAYMKANNITATKTDLGVYIQTLTPGTGPKPNNGEFVSLRYAGKLLNGQEFDNNTDPGEPLLPIQLGAGGAIPGFEYGVKQLAKGTKARVFIPSTLGYGAQGRAPSIGPNESLVFDLEVVDISKQQPAPPAMPNTPPLPPMDSATQPKR